MADTQTTTAPHVLDSLARLVDLIDEIARQAHDVIHEAAPDDRAGLLEGVTAIEHGSRQLTFEITLAAGDWPMRCRQPTGDTTD